MSAAENRKIRQIMKINDEVGNVSGNAVILVGQAMDKFLALLINQSYQVSQSHQRETIQMEDIVQTIENNKKQFEFLFEGITHAIDTSTTELLENSKTASSSSHSKTKALPKPRQRKGGSNVSNTSKTDTSTPVDEITTATNATTTSNIPPKTKKVRKSVTVVAPTDNPASIISTATTGEIETTPPEAGNEIVNNSDVGVDNQLSTETEMLIEPIANNESNHQSIANNE